MKVLFKRWIYLGYYFRRMDWPLLAKFMGHVQGMKGWSRARQWRSIIHDSLRFNISILEYYQFRFFDLGESAKGDWAGTGTMYEFQRRANPRGSRSILSDKREFYRAYGKFFRHQLMTLDEIRSDKSSVRELLERDANVVVKEATGNCGKGVLIVPARDITPDTLVDYMEREGFDLLETFVHQHSVLNALSPSAVNTVRIFTQIRSTGEYEVLGCRLRISINSPVDNLAAGNMAAPIDRDTGRVKGPGVFSDITREPLETHPVTGCPIVGLEIPYWQETLALVEEASLLHPENRSVGWDVVITEQGPGLIEGNHDWCKLVWQLPVAKGLKHRLDFTL
jgi:hypothetical protein